MNAFIVLAVALTLCAMALVAVPLIRTGGKGYRITALLSALLIGSAAFLAYGRISDYPWPSAEETAQSAETGGLQRGPAANPSDPSAWITLGKEHLRQGRYTEARDAFRQALTLDPAGSDELRMDFAAAAIMADPGALTAEAGGIVEEVLARHPEDPKALWYGGMTALSRGDNEGARVRWSRLLELSPPEEVRRILEKQIAALGTPETASSEPADGRGVPAMPSISVRIAVAPELAATTAGLGDRAALFLIARSPETAGPPLAVVRRRASGLPADIVISDRDRMGGKTSAASFDRIQLTARISRTGNAIAAPDDLYGEALWQRGSDQPVQLVIDRVVQ